MQIKAGTNHKDKPDLRWRRAAAAIGTRVSLARVNGAELWYELQGEGPPLVLLHAGGTDARMWDEQIAGLAERFRVLRLDARGYGRSSLPGGPVSFVDEPRWADGGRGTGPSRARRGLVRRPGRGRDGADAAAAGLGAHPGVANGARSRAVRGRASVRRRRGQAGRARRGGGGDRARSSLLARRPHRRLEDLDPALRERLAAMERQAYANYLEAHPKPEREAGPPHRQLARIAVPTLVVAGELDVEEVLENADRLEAEIPGARKGGHPGRRPLGQSRVPEPLHHADRRFPRRATTAVLNSALRPRRLAQLVEGRRVPDRPAQRAPQGQHEA
jgi:3-oxoadipate enol-lactonase